MGILFRREYCDTWDSYGNVCRNSSWYSWGRWVAFAVIVAAAFMIFFLFACFNARRRRYNGLRPHPGTAWLAPPPGLLHQINHTTPTPTTNSSRHHNIQLSRSPMDISVDNHSNRASNCSHRRTPTLLEAIGHISLRRALHPKVVPRCRWLSDPLVLTEANKRDLK
ncbi:resistance to Congo red protein [Aspergillus clavatus NRRL 1]|uniref:Uncharacterized protein n=1 Tax=Aspergillus clavatus (strain ATCC 1007 / CBS 513.65 / DSM 816 / NCTC 3887 / NRRL 1 / QM 1276 / 107) TaxID=344612 RepID=A1CTB1_ASPCL|nr:uncharacterized protein ACLA_082390 [Aspergillus clavatus NRRL 1]EAW06548.1 hypothetical protein ACLA_082390 [Aspergillus clavatus NRRL 1]